MKYGFIKEIINCLHNKWGGLVIKKFNSIFGVQGSNFTNDIVVINDGILIKYSGGFEQLFEWRTLIRLPKLSQPHFEASVSMKLTLLKVRTWNPLGLPKTQSLITRVKTPCIEVFFISLKRSWSVHVENGLIWAIRTSIAQVMVERRAESQTGSLTPNH